MSRSLSSKGSFSWAPHHHHSPRPGHHSNTASVPKIKIAIAATPLQPVTAEGQRCTSSRGEYLSFWWVCRWPYGSFGELCQQQNISYTHNTTKKHYNNKYSSCCAVVALVSQYHVSCYKHANNEDYCILLFFCKQRKQYCFWMQP